MLEDREGVEKLHFELSSESRLNILRELNRNNCKMTMVASKLALTTTEASRQLQRLSNASLVEKQSDGSFSITDYGRLVLRISSNLEFIQMHREYFLTHDVWRLPEQFLDRLGELSDSILSMDVMENMNKIGRMAREAREYIWMGGMDRPPNVESILTEAISSGEKGRILLVERLVPNNRMAMKAAQGFEYRAIDAIPVNILMTEKEAGLSFPFIGGRSDYAGFIGSDPRFMGWVKDLFLFYWDKGRRV